MLWLQTNTDDCGMLNLGGSLTRQFEKQSERFPSHSHISEIGKLVEEAENKVRFYPGVSVYVEVCVHIMSRVPSQSHSCRKFYGTLVPWGKNIDPEKFVKETLSRVGYVCEMNFDPLARHKIFSGCSLITCSK